MFRVLMGELLEMAWLASAIGAISILGALAGMAFTTY